MRIAIVLFALALTACDSNGRSSLTSPPETADDSPLGIWDGTIKEGAATINTVSCLAASNGRAACLFFDPNNGVLAGAGIGSISGSGDTVSINGTAFTTPAYVLANGSHVGGFTGSALKVTERAKLTGNVSVAGHTYSLDTGFNPLFDHDSSLAAIAAVYRSFEVNGDISSLSIDGNGALFSQSQAGCIASGTVAVIDPNSNGYTVTLQVSNCGSRDGVYSGVAITNADDTQLLFAVFNSIGGVVATAVK